MGTLVRVSLRPLGVWTTPWQADSLLGAMACAWVRSHGESALRRDFLDPWLDCEPKLVISDAFPGDSLPAPACLPLWWDWCPGERKQVKKHEWMTKADFCRVQKGEKPELEVPDVSVDSNVRLRNSLSRSSGTTGDAGELFEVPFFNLKKRNERDKRDAKLTIFARVSNDGENILMEALKILGQTGYGANASVGHGSFEIVDGPTSCHELDNIPEADGFISFSTFQPAATDPLEGFWKLFIKYGKIAPEFHSCEVVFKRPQVMLRAGACFRTEHFPKPFYGTSIGPERLLSKSSRKTLASSGIRPVQAAFGLAIPMMWQKDIDQ